MIDGSPSFSAVVVDALEARFKAERENGKITLIGLMLDEMTIVRCFAHVDIGNGLKDDRQRSGVYIGRTE